MGKSDTLANINLYAVLRNIEDLCELDKEMMKQIAGVDLAIQFKVKNGPSANLSFSKGVCRFKRGTHPSTITLFFTSTEHFNKMIAGEAIPICVFRNIRTAIPEASGHETGSIRTPCRLH